MTQPGEHLADEILSASIDDQLTPDEASVARVHLEACLVCRARLDELQAVVGLLRRMPSIEPPGRLFGLRLVADPPNVVRLRRWYTFARAGAASLAAVFVFASAGAVYVGSQPAASPASVALRSQGAAAGAAAQAVPAAPPAASPAAALAARSAPAPAAPAPAAPAPAAPAAAAPAAAARPQAAPTPAGAEVADQTTATSSVRPLPTTVPTPARAPAPQDATPAPVAAQPGASPPADVAATLWTAAAIAGVLTVLGVLVALLVRRRLAHLASNSVLE